MRKISMLFVCFLLQLSICFGQSQWDLPQEPIGQVTAKFLDAVADGDAAVLQNLVTSTFDPALRDSNPMNTHLGFLSGLHQQLGSFRITSVDIPSAEQIRMTLTSTENDSALVVSLQITAQAPYRIAGLGVGPDHQRQPFADLPELKAYLEAETAEGRFSGAVKVVRNDSIVFQDAYGYANREKNIPNRLDTQFNIGSINKEFTAVAIAQLAQSGKLNFDDTISNFLEDFPKPAANQITIRQLLQHRAGTGDYLMLPKFHQLAPTITSVDQLYQFLKNEPLHFEPGQSQRYSNSGFVILGKIVEAVTGKDYYQYVRERVYRPAGMEDSDSFDPGTHTDRHATGYTSLEGDDGKMHSGNKFYTFKGSPAGGGYSTIDDLAAFDRALRSAQLLSKEYTMLLINRFRPVPAEVELSGGLGIAGGAPGLNAILESDWESGFTVVVVANMDPPVAEELGLAIMDMLRGQ